LQHQVPIYLILYFLFIGRLIDMIRNKFLDTTHLKLLIVDEAD